MNKSFGAALLLLAVTVLASGCAQYENKRGVLARWQDVSGHKLVAGETTRQQVLDTLGPPSQLIALGDETVLYYLFERSRGEGLVLIVYNQFKVDTRYDRAIFFFDANDRLTNHATDFAAAEAP
ncbi:outer membrane protein assembly factor BamE [Seongchinamella sediminis]|uniref:Outer membrane protein assembly factor BamE n=1 Tax=Seongchinamella sediminis TaxID=2283635 RepID=A0A3L7DXX8_9GAMM|nr:outer membrane protein assembly factor BamE [Seongchinamella sediminis]RLQ22448.1 outer membrane protein assembly factor BamE [Seongchinamella sediminis]